MAFIPSAAQRVKIAAPAKKIAAELNNVLDALTQYGNLYDDDAAAVVQAEADTIVTHSRLVQIYQAAQSIQEEIMAAVLAYEGIDELPERVEE